MKREPVCVPPEMPPLRALELMRSFGIGALPVVVDEHLVGIITEHDFMNVAGMLLLEQLGCRAATIGLLVLVTISALIPTASATVRQIPRPAAWPRLEEEPAAAPAPLAA